MNKYDLLASSVKQIEIGANEVARNTLHELQKSLNPSVRVLDLQYSIFCSALLKRLDNKYVTQNIYLQEFPEESQINIFKKFTSDFPIISLAHIIANELICQKISLLEPFILIDIGIGKGVQVLNLLKKLSLKKIQPEIIIYGIDPSEDNLIEAEHKLTKSAKEYGFNLRFYPIPQLIEELTEEQWDELASLPGKKIVNSAFSFHHIQDKRKETETGIDPRQKIIQKLHAIQPEAFILVEPNSNHNNSNLWYRFQNSWEHFRLVFEVIDLLKLKTEEQFLLKNCFFAREVDDILSNQEDSRCERHETVDTWLQRLSIARFKTRNLLSFSIDFLPSIVDIVIKNKGYIGIQYKNTTIVSVMCGET